MPGSVLDLGKTVVDSLYKNSSPFQIYILFGEGHHQQQKKVKYILCLIMIRALKTKSKEES